MSPPVHRMQFYGYQGTGQQMGVRHAEASMPGAAQHVPGSVFGMMDSGEVIHPNLHNSLF